MTDSLMTFPCDFTIKVFGKATPEFEAAVFSILSKHIPHFSDKMIQSRSSKHDNYAALSINIHVTSREQLDKIYVDLSACPLILMAL